MSRSRRCAHCETMMRNAPEWHRLCFQCYRLARVEVLIGKAAKLLREIQRMDGAR